MFVSLINSVLPIKYHSIYKFRVSCDEYYVLSRSMLTCIWKPLLKVWEYIYEEKYQNYLISHYINLNDHYEYFNPCLSVHFALIMIYFQSCTFYTDKKFPALKYKVNFWICTWWGKYYFSSNPHRTFMSPNICSLNQMHDEWVFFLL